MRADHARVACERPVVTPNDDVPVIRPEIGLGAGLADVPTQGRARPSNAGSFG